MTFSLIDWDRAHVTSNSSWETGMCPVSQQNFSTQWNAMEVSFSYYQNFDRVILIIHGRDVTIKSCYLKSPTIRLFDQKLTQGKRKDPPKFRITGPFKRNSPVIGKCPSQMASKAISVSMSWCLYAFQIFYGLTEVDCAKICSDKQARK